MKYKLPLILVLFMIISSLQLYADEIHEAAKKGDLARVKAILKKSPEAINEIDRYRRNALLYAMKAKNRELTIFLIKKGANVKIQDRFCDPNIDYNNKRALMEDYMNYPIHYAVFNNWKDVARLILDSGADVNQKNLMGYTPLCIAIYDGKEEMFHFLMSRGADINIAPKEKTTLCLAAESGSTEIVRELIAKGMSIKPLKQPAASDDYT